MKQFTFYNILSWIMLPFAILFGIFAAFSVLIALANPTALIPAFLLICVVIYLFTSRNFFQKGVRSARSLKRSRKDLIKVNAYVSLLCGGYWLVQGVMAITNPQVFTQAAQQFMKVNAEAAQQVHMTEGMIVRILTGSTYLLALFSVVLLIHIFLTLRLLKAYDHVFNKE